jgi:PAS domain S-box-containing protein
MKIDNKRKNERNKGLKSVRKIVKKPEPSLKKNKHTDQNTAENKRAENKIDRVLQEWQTTFDATNDAMWILDKDQRILRSNKTAERIFQRSNKELIGKHCWEIVHGTKQPIPECPVLRAKKSLRRESMDLQIGKGWFEVIVDPILDASDRYDGAVHIVSDITVRKKAEEALRENEDKFKYVFDYSVVGKSITFPSGEIHVNKAFCDMLGYSQGELQNKNWQDVTHPDDIGLTQNNLDLIISGEKGFARFVKRYIHKNGAIVWGNVSTSLRRDEKKQPLYFITSVLNITEHRHAEELLRDKEHLLSESQRIAHIGGWKFEINGSSTWTHETYRIFGVSPESFTPTTESFFKLIHPEDRTAMQDWIDKCASGNTPDEFIFRIILPDGPIRFLLGHGELICGADKKPLYMAGTVQDITERNMAEEEILKERALLRTLIDNLPVGIFVKDKNYRKTIVNPLHSKEIMGHLKFLGENSDIDILGKTDFEVFPKELAQKFFEEDKKVIRDGSLVLNEEGFGYSEEGNQLYLLVSKIPLRDNKGEIIGMVGVANDVTERKRAEEVIRESEARFSRLTQANFEGIAIHDKGRILDANQALADLFGYEISEILGMNVLDIAAPESRDLVRNNFLSGYEKPYEALGLRKNGTIFVGELRGKQMPYRGDIVRVTAIRDITDRKSAEKKLLESEERFRRIFEDHAAVKLLIDPDSGEIIDANKSAAAYYGWSREELKRMKIEQINTLTPDEVKQEMEKALSQKRIQFEFKHRRKDGSIRDVEVFSSKILIGNKNVLHSIVHDITERKRAEEALQNKERYQRALLDNFPFAVWLKDTDSRFLAVNQAFANTFNIPTADELVGKTDFDIAERNHAEEYRAHDRVVMESRTKHIVEDEIKGLEKGSLYETYKAPVIGKNDELLGIVGFLRDITERKHAEKVLRESEYRYRMMFESTPIAINITRGTEIVFANSSYLKMFGFSTFDELKRFAPLELFAPEWRSTVLENIERRSKGLSVPNYYEAECLRSDGTKFPIIMYLTKILFTDGQATVGFILDITERKRADEALQESELRFRSLYENATIGLYRTTPDGTILLANPTLEKMLGYTSFQELAERNLEKDGFEPTYQRKEFLDKIERDGLVNGLESKWICRDGKTIVVLESARAIRDSQGNTMYYDGTVEDITERKHMEEGLRNVQKLEGLGTLAGGIAHDFNNILGIILAYNSSIKKFKDDSKNLDLATETIAKAVNRGKTLVQQILTFARKSETSFGAVNVNDVAMEIVTMIYEMFPKTVTCSQNFDKSLPYINADRSQIHQTLLNLCINARDALPNGGVLTMKTSMESAAHLRIRHPDAGEASYVCLEVNDTGEGMTPETQKRIFEPFFTTKSIGKGTGLGLAVVFGVVQTHKGFIEVESELGTGTTFKIFLPVSDVANPMNEKEEESLEEIQGGTETLLVVEDEEMLAIPLQMALVDKGYNVLIAGDGFTALKIYHERKNDIALVLTDLGLPTISGLEVCHEIKQINPKERMILATGFLDPEVKTKFLKAGIEHFLYKPYDLSKVLKEIRMVLDGK